MSLLWRSELRRGWRGLLVFTVLVAVIGGLTLAALAGARRTASSFNRFLASSRSQDALVFARDVTPAEVARLRALPGVDAVGYARALMLVRPDGEFLAAGGPLDDAMFRDVYRPRILDGRAPRPDATDEIALGESQARGVGLGVGDTLRLLSYGPDQVDALRVGDARVTPTGPTLRLRIVGISRTPIDLSLQGSDGGIVLVPRGVVDRYGAEIGDFSGPGGAVLFARLERGRAGVPTFLAQLREVLGSGSFDVDPAALTTGAVQESIDLVAIAVLTFGVVAGLAGVIAVGIIIGRQIQLAAFRQLPVRDLGLTRPLRALAVLVPTFLAVVAGTIGAVVLAWLASPMFPFGVAGEAEPRPGLQADVVVLGLGALGILVVLGVMAALVAWRAVRVTRSGIRVARPSTFARLLQPLAGGPTAAVGIHMAVTRRTGVARAPVGTSLAGVGLAVFGITAMAVFGVSLGNLFDTPQAYGRPWDVRVADRDDDRLRVETATSACAPLRTSLRERLRMDPDVDSLADACNLDVTVDGRAVGAYAITALKGSMAPTVLEGRYPRRRDEIALGSETFRAVQARIGGQVRSRSQGRSARYRVVGRVVVPPVDVPQAIADGAVFTGLGLQQLDSPRRTSASTLLVVRFRDGADHRAAIARIRRMADAGTEFDAPVSRPETPPEIDRLRPIGRAPILLAGFLAITGAIAMAYLIVTSVHQRRREFAVLKSVGFTRGQVMRAVAWQATTVVALGTPIGVLAGLVAGGVLWRAAAERVGVLAIVDVPVLITAGVAGAAVVVANLVAAIPARSAARTHPAATLRSE